MPLRPAPALPFLQRSRPSFALRRPELHFACSAPLRFVHHLTLRCDPQTLFECIASGEHEKHWFPDFAGLRWHDTPGVGATRTYRLSYMRIVEHFTRWEPGKALEFWVSECSLPLLDQFAESYAIRPLNHELTELTWHVGYEPRRALCALHPILRPIFARDFATASRQLGAYAEKLAIARGTR
ncbi:MAG: hypothetical protein H6722_25930 [Sandaracinus sp.]|nr:hypothetical protein [Sandaracinus sp.]MCB9624380.1 hypothetical protein [Sandaracinus sp.]